MMYIYLQIQEGSVAYIVDERPAIPSQEIIKAKCNGDDVEMHVSYDKDRRINKISISIDKKRIYEISISKIKDYIKDREISGAEITRCSYPIKNRSIAMKIFSVVSYKTVPVVMDLGLESGKWKLRFISDNPIINPDLKQFK